MCDFCEAATAGLADSAQCCQGVLEHLDAPILREAYEAAVAGREELSQAISRLQPLPCGGT